MTNEDAIWTELSFSVMPGSSEAVTDLLQELTGNGVTIEPPIEALGPDEGYTLDESGPLVLRAYVYGRLDSDRRGAIEHALSEPGTNDAIVSPLVWREIREEDWAEAWKEYYHVEHVGRVAIRPEWREYAAAPGEVVVSLDPGMAFGTGQHPTTRMALQALQDLLRPNDYVLDLGAGSGILALAALALGADRAVTVDTEEQAFKSTRDNAALNGMTDRIHNVQGTLDVVANDGPYDLVLANINAATVTALASDLFRVVKSGREVVGGGIIREREEGVVEALADAGFDILERLSEGEWRCLIARKPAAA